MSVAGGMAVRRRVDWPLILGAKAPVPRVVVRSMRGKLAALLSAFDEILALDDTDAILRRAVELAQERIGLARAGIFLLDRAHNRMLGTWGSDLAGGIVDEHHIMYDLTATDLEAFRRAEQQGEHFTVFDNCPIVEHRERETRVVGRGWVACTPIRSARATIGMLFNDTGLSGAPVDEGKQAHAAILCSLLGTLLDPVRGHHVGKPIAWGSAGFPRASPSRGGSGTLPGSPKPRTASAWRDATV